MSTPPQTAQRAAAPPIVALTGFMGAGKTSIGHALAALLGWLFVDLDHEIELQQKAPIRELFRTHGATLFRALETAALRSLLAQVSVPTVIALGGGTFIQSANVDALRNSGAQVVFLETPIEQMLQRCCSEDHSPAENLRPLAADPKTFRALYEERLPRYRTADLTVSTAGKTAEESATEIAAALGIRKISD